MGSVFVITGAINNGLASITDKSIEIDQLDKWFEKYELLGRSMGSIL